VIVESLLRGACLTHQRLLCSGALLAGIASDVHVSALLRRGLANACVLRLSLDEAGLSPLVELSIRLDSKTARLRADHMFLSFVGSTAYAQSVVGKVLAGCVGWGWLAWQRTDIGDECLFCAWVWSSWHCEWNVWLSSASGELWLSAAGNSRGCSSRLREGESIGFRLGWQVIGSGAVRQGLGGWSLYSCGACRCFCQEGLCAPWEAAFS
jgi:hypothetical protein